VKAVIQIKTNALLNGGNLLRKVWTEQKKDYHLTKGTRKVGETCTLRKPVKQAKLFQPKEGGGEGTLNSCGSPKSQKKKRLLENLLQNTHIGAREREDAGHPTHAIVEKGNAENVGGGQFQNGQKVGSTCRATIRASLL